MGCDIHCFAEIKKNKKWSLAPKIFPNPYYKPDKENKIDEDGYEWNAKMTNDFFRNRNYDVFGMLADVRNGRGFAGVSTGCGFQPLLEWLFKKDESIVPEDFNNCRGIPDDCCEEIRKGIEEYGLDGHSHNWFTPDELSHEDYYKLVTTHSGKVNINQFKEYLKFGEPKSGWYNMVSGGNTKHIEKDEMLKKIKDKFDFEKSKDEFYCEISWESPYRESINDNYFENIKILKQYEKDQKADSSRVVFFFDN